LFNRIMNNRFLLLFATVFTFAVSATAATPDYVPMKVIQTDAVIHPRRATDMGVTSGEVHISVQVDETGKLTDLLVTAYTHPLLAESAVQALKRWNYEPAWLHGKPRGATVDLTFIFEHKGLVVVDLTVTSYVQLRDVQLRPNAYTYGARTLRQLDRIPTPTKVVQPAYPVEAGQKQQTAVVTVFFFIDEQGRVRLPAVSRETSEMNDALAAAAVNAVSQWQFEPPLSKGVPVLVAARQDFNFKPK
jgi:TonB family protein